jgi:hypothetical protein
VPIQYVLPCQISEEEVLAINMLLLVCKRTKFVLFGLLE